MSQVVVGPPLAPVVARLVEQARLELGAVTGVTPLDGWPPVTDWRTFLDAFRQPDTRIEGWVVEVSWTEDALTLGPVTEVTATLRLQGFRSVDVAGASREAFRGTVARVFDAFRHSRLDGQVDYCDPIVSRLDRGATVEERMTGDVLCHVCDIDVIGRFEVVA